MTPDYDVIAIGGGAAGLTAAGVAVHLGARTLLIERHRLGGDCTWTGCIPSKTLLHAASIAETVRTADRFGVSTGHVSVDFAHVMARIRSTREQVYHDADRPEILEDLGIHVRIGAATFVDPHTLNVTDGSSSYEVTGRYIIICTGGSPSAPPIPGLEETPYLTSESLFELTERPDHLLVLGGGPIGIEMAQAFRRLESKVTVIEAADRILSNDNAELANLLRRRLEDEGVQFMLDAEVRRIDGDADSVTAQLKSGGPVEGSALLVATGRRPNVENLGLEKLGVELSKKGIQVDDRCRTNVSNIFAVGDVTGRYQFTHMSEHMAKTAVMNALLKVPTSINTSAVPWVTYTDPELAHVGATLEQLRSDGTKFEMHRFPYTKLDRAVTEGREIGAIVVYATKWTGKILGASILGAHAGDLIGEFALAMRNGIALRQISDTIHPYPSYGLGIRRVADQWYAQRHSPRSVKALQSIFGYRGPRLDVGPDDII